MRTRYDKTEVMEKHLTVLIVYYLYINLRRSRDCLCMSVAVWVCLCHRAASFTYFVEVLRCPHIIIIILI